MASYTSYFSLYHGLQDTGLKVVTPRLKEGESYSDEEQLETLDEILSCINTLDDYDSLITILEEMESQITLRFLYFFFEALSSVEERVWKSAGMEPPVRDLIEDNLDLLLDNYIDFVQIVEGGLIQWTKEQGYFDDEEKYDFIKRRNEIYARYVVLAGKVIDACY